jgi:8-oxo-dGTP pyrophosphatase MutT (NUDIX family)
VIEPCIREVWEETGLEVDVQRFYFSLTETRELECMPDHLEPVQDAFSGRQEPYLR